MCLNLGKYGCGMMQNNRHFIEANQCIFIEMEAERRHFTEYGDSFRRKELWLFEERDYRKTPAHKIVIYGRATCTGKDVS